MNEYESSPITPTETGQPGQTGLSETSQPAPSKKEQLVNAIADAAVQGVQSVSVDGTSTTAMSMEDRLKGLRELKNSEINRGNILQCIVPFGWKRG